MMAGVVANRLGGIVSLLLIPTPDRSTPEGRARDRHRKAALSAIAAALAKVLAIGVTLISIPMTKSYLGSERFGIWLVISSFTVILAFADMGLGNGVLNAIAAEHGRDDPVQMKRVVSSGYFVLTLIAILVLLLFCASYPWVTWHHLFNVKSQLARSEAGPAVAAFMICFTLAIPVGLVQKVQTGLQQGFTTSLWQCAGSVFLLVGLIAATRAHADLKTLVLVLSGAPVFAGALNTVHFFVWGSGKALRPTLSAISRDAITQVGRIGLLFFLLQLVMSFAYGADLIIIAQTLGADSVPQYAIPERLFSIVSMILMMALTPLWPAYGEAIARGDHDWASHTLKRVLLISLAAAAALSLPLAIAAPTLISLWIGQAVSASPMLLAGMAAWRITEAGSTAVATFLNGSNAMAEQVRIALVLGPAMLASKVLLVHLFGLAGIPWGAVAAFLLVGLVPTYRVVRRRLQAMQTQ